VTATAWAGWVGSTRVVVARVEVGSAGTAAARLSRTNTTLAQRSYTLRKGANTLRLAVPRRVRPGWSRLVLTVRTPAAAARVVSVRVRLPRARA
jgi:hypothetical protein